MPITPLSPLHDLAPGADQAPPRAVAARTMRGPVSTCILACAVGLTLVGRAAAVAGEVTPLVQCTIPTTWGKALDPAKVLPEYPRPQLVRADWLNLNGTWDYAVSALAADRPASWTGRIVVPFPIESLLSGVTGLLLKCPPRAR
ncbi:MAG: hypothetical protein H0X38_04525 [Planctomycetes bacterium]|nr:hypothetical protein [Planctomycetota bacterium]